MRRRDLLRQRLGLPSWPAAEPRARVVALSPRDTGAPARPALERAHAGVVAVTVATANHLARARVLASSFAAHHPDVPLYVLRLEPEPAVESHGLAIVEPSEIGFPDNPYLPLKLDTLELCCAAKPYLVLWALERLRAERVLYVDADFCFYARATDLLAAAAAADVVVTPHLTSPFPAPDRHWERPTLGDVALGGVLNAGLFAVRRSPEALAFLRSWKEMCTGFGAFDAQFGLQSEQNSFNWVMAFCEDVRILRHRGYNVAYWNLHERSLTHETSGYDVDGRPLVAFHWSGFDPAEPTRLSRHDRRHRPFHHGPLAELVRDYARRLEAVGPGEACGEPPWRRFPSGVPIDERMRALFKRHELPFATGVDPFTPRGEAILCRALLAPAPGQGTLCPLLLADLMAGRPDVGALHPDWQLRPESLWRWFVEHAAPFYGYGELVDRHRPTFVPSDRLDALAAALQPVVVEGLAAPLGADRSALLSRLRSAAPVDGELLGRVASAADELYGGTTTGLLRGFLAARPEIRAMHPDLLFGGAAAFADWLEACGETLEGLPSGSASTFRRVASGRALARVFCCVNEVMGRPPELPLGFVGVRSDELLRRLLPSVGAAPFDLEDLAMLQWILDEEPWRGLPLAIELRPQGGGSFERPSRAEEEALLAPVLGLDPRFRAALDAYRSERSVRDSDRPEGDGARGGAGGSRAAHLFGFGGSPIGLGNMSRGLAKALRATGYRVLENVFSNLTLRDDLDLDEVRLRHDPEIPLNLWVSYPHREQRLFDLYPRAVSSGRKNVLYLAWEQSIAPAHWARAYAEFDEVWAISDFAAASLRKALDREVHVVPCALDPSELPERVARRDTPLPPDRFVFTYTFDAASSMERKNPLGAVEAFARAFRRDEPVTLWLRATNALGPGSRAQLRRLADRGAATGLDIRLDLGARSRAEILRLLAASDAYLSLHRAEGFGYTCAEAMALGVPTIGTGYSGNLDYMTSDNSFLVEARECEVRVPDGPFVRGSRWAEPDLEHAAELMRQVVADREGARRVARRGRDEVRRRLAPERVGALCARLLAGREGAAPEGTEGTARS